MRKSIPVWITGIRGSRSGLKILPAFFAISLPCCANLLAPATQTKPPGGPTVDEWHLVFQMSGGFAGFDKKLEVANTGSVTAADRKRRIQAMTKASAQELGAINSLLSDLNSLNPARNPNCRDCIEY